jgi:sugar/nucleoside kinase (ribokinase family)
MIGGRPLVAVVGDVGLDVLVIPGGPVAVGSDTRADVRVTQGGAGANTAAWLVSCGADALLIGRIGADDAGGLVRADLDRSGVRTHLTADRARATCCVVVVLDEAGRRTMFPSRGASGALAAADVAAADLTDVDHLHLSGYVLLDPSSRAAGVAALSVARAAGLTTSVDPQASALLGDPDQFLADIGGVDLLLPNEDELAALAGADGHQAARRLLDRVGAVAYTSGDRGATWVDASGVTTAPALPIGVVDPTGAGDAFDAGLLAAWLTGSTPEGALLAGVRAGARAVSTVGARPRESG